MFLTFAGANQEVTGSCYHLHTPAGNVVIDCGIFQGGTNAEEKNALPFPFDPHEVKALVITHAHFDHTGRIPKLVKEGYRGPIYATGPTVDLTMLNLRDAVHLMDDEARRHGHEPLYRAEDVEALSSMWKVIDYHEETEVLPGVSIYATDAGHILGSTSIRVTTNGKSIVFSGDLGNTPVPLLHELECQLASDYLVIESTYGNRVHEPHSERFSVLKNTILETIRDGGNLLIPALAFGRAQELLCEIPHLMSTRQVPRISVYLDSPLAISATEVFEENFTFFNKQTRLEFERGHNPFHFPGLHLTESADESKAIARKGGAKIIIAGSGMMNGGRILHHLTNHLSDPRTRLLIVGYQVEGSIGRQLHDGADSVRIYGHHVPVRAEVISCGAFSGHADFPRLLSWLDCFKMQQPKRIFVTHGELNSALSFSQAIEEQRGISSSVPAYGDQVDLV